MAANVFPSYSQQVDITEVPDFNKMYELYDPCTVMFFFRNKHMMLDLGTGNNNKIYWAITVRALTAVFSWTDIVLDLV